MCRWCSGLPAALPPEPTWLLYLVGKGKNNFSTIHFDGNWYWHTRNSNRYQLSSQTTSGWGAIDCPFKGSLPLIKVPSLGHRLVPLPLFGSDKRGFEFLKIAHTSFLLWFNFSLERCQTQKLILLRCSSAPSSKTVSEHSIRRMLTWNAVHNACIWSWSF